MSGAVAFDALKFVERLEAGGFTHAQAKAAAEAFSEATGQELATKRDLREVETRLEAKIETSVANLKVDILRWLVVTQIALGGFVYAAIKFVK
ncbi:hypothetical protein [Methylocystis heyeri]|uniref:DUF1640 domain-containing protein n=1 Tax=Methylocystis heyeri TaxID=391905 RepID=A0A6B8KIQ8_9HYPH|nr:hypothetical protein [Methylocystis heyeri]QGM47557.1 hypothetical protein H2LOC_018740 [Methylocystis heyeri]